MSHFDLAVSQLFGGVCDNQGCSNSSIERYCLKQDGSSSISQHSMRWALNGYTLYIARGPTIVNSPKLCKAHPLRIAAVRDLRSERPLPAPLVDAGLTMRQARMSFKGLGAVLYRATHKRQFRTSQHNHLHSVFCVTFLHDDHARSSQDKNKSAADPTCENGIDGDCGAHQSQPHVPNQDC